MAVTALLPLDERNLCREGGLPAGTVAPGATLFFR